MFERVQRVKQRITIFSKDLLGIKYLTQEQFEKVRLAMPARNRYYHYEISAYSAFLSGIRVEKKLIIISVIPNEKVTTLRNITSCMKDRWSGIL